MPHPLFCAFSQSSREDASGPVPDDRIPGGMKYTAELKDGQCDECEEDQGVGSLSRSARKTDGDLESHL